MNNLEYVIFYLLFFLFGGTFFRIIFREKNLKKQILSTSQYIFYPIVGVSILSFIVFFLNLFLPIEEIKNILIIIVVTISLLNLKQLADLLKDLFFLINYLIIPLIISISSYKIKFHYDSEAYHLTTQALILQSKLTFGSAKFFIWQGHSSLYEYIQTLLSFDGNFIYQHYLNLLFFNVLINFICYHIIFKKNIYFYNLSLFVLIFGILDNFGIGGGSNGFLEIQMVGKPDIAVGVMYFIISIFAIFGIYKQNLTEKELLLLTIFFTFLIQVRVTSLSLILLLFPLVIRNTKNFKIVMKSKLFIWLVLYNLLWIFKNIATSSCIFFPLKQSCLNFLPWNLESNFVALTKGYEEWGLSYKFNSSPLTFFSEWFNLGYNYQQVPNLLISLSVLLFLRFLIMKKHKGNNLYLYFCLILIFLLNLYFTFHIRYLFGYILLIVSVIPFNTEIKKKFKKFENKYIFYLLIIVLSVGIPRGYSYNYLFDNLNYYELNIEYGDWMYKKNPDGYGYIGYQNKCFDIYNCSTFLTSNTKSIELYKIFGNYKMFK
tara:strand:- start:917 stop:2548 length:1632 start_codon:yes stop_codon:yes gene_type:complete